MNGKQEARRRDKPLLVWDGDCGFCRFWVQRWRGLTGDRVAYATADAVADGLGVPAERFRQSVVLVETDGTLHFGAEAVFRSLSNTPGLSWLGWLYAHLPGLAPVSEAAYAFVAKRRTLFSRLTRLGWGELSVAPAFTVGPWIFLRLLGLVYLVAFASLWPQLDGLIGSHGILPVAEYLPALKEQLGVSAWWRAPTLCWLDSSDRMLDILGGGGIVLSILLILGIAPTPVLALLWTCYLSLVTAGQTFLSFQWDNLLLETGLLAIFLAPLSLRPRGSVGTPPIPRFLLWWLLFRLTVLSGAVKLASADESWLRLTALQFHQETQPLPNPLSWFVHQLPAGIHRLGAQGMFFVELVVPFLIWAPRRLRHLAAFLLIGLQAAIALTGNYGFFNLLTIVLCLLLFDDQSWPRRLRKLLLFGGRRAPGRRPLRWPSRLLGPFALVVLFLTLTAFVERLDRRSVPAALRSVASWARPLRSFNAYGLFAVMTTRRPELRFEGSLDGQEWREYRFRYKPGELDRWPRQVAPHMPRLDWQMWFAALSNPRSPQSAWAHRFCRGLLQGRPEILGLLAEDPFPEGPPREIRVRVWEYRFTDPATLRSEGDWWSRELLGTWTTQRR